MTKQDFELIARVLRESRGWQRDISVTLAHDFADALYATNRRFDRARFIAACNGEDSVDSAGRKVRYS